MLAIPINIYKLTMIKFPNHLSIFFALIISLTSCYPLQMSKLRTLFTPIPESSKTIDIPKYGTENPFTGYPYVYWHFSKQKQNQLGLASPETSHDSLLFRIWITHPTGKTNQPHVLVKVKKDTVSWQAELILMRVDFESSTLSETITSTKRFTLNPLITDWETLADSLSKLKIATLPTDESIPGYYTTQRGYARHTPTISFEYATKDIYRFYQYNDITRIPDEFWQPRHVIAILELLEHEFQWDTQATIYFQNH